MFNKYYLIFLICFKSKNDKNIFLSFPIATCLLLVYLLCYTLAFAGRQVITGTNKLRGKKVMEKNKTELIIFLHKAQFLASYNDVLGMY